MFATLRIIVSKIFLDYFLLVKGFLLSFFTKKQAMKEDIDFVVLWVDGSDPEWLKTKEKYEKEFKIYKGSNGEERYRDWDFFHYWFRAVEKYAPWVRNVYLVTCGQVPKWLDVNHPKLRLVNHNDFIDKKYLPTFNSSAIEINLHKIKGLGEYFVYFNDDIILTKPVKPEDFFQGGKPLISAAGYPIRNYSWRNVWHHNLFSIMGMVSQYDWEKIIRRNPEKWFCYKYRQYLRHNWRMCVDSYMSGFYYVHFASPLRKSTLKKTEEVFNEAFKETSANKFRSPYDITQLLFKIFEIADGNFIPCSPYKYGRFLSLASQYQIIENNIKQQKHKMVCVNDSYDIDKDSFEIIKKRIIFAFDQILPDKSTFEI